MKNLFGVIVLILCSASALSDTQTSKSFGNYSVQFSALNSSFIAPEIAETYRLARGKDKGLINIALLEDKQIGGQTAEVSGYVSNIFAQQQALTFLEVREGNAVYYLAPFNFDNEDFLTFKINVKKDPADQGFNVSFQRTFYHDE